MAPLFPSPVHPASLSHGCPAEDIRCPQVTHPGRSPEERTVSRRDSTNPATQPPSPCGCLAAFLIAAHPSSGPPETPGAEDIQLPQEPRANVSATVSGAVAGWAQTLASSPLEQSGSSAIVQHEQASVCAKVPSATLAHRFTGEAQPAHRPVEAGRPQAFC